MFEPPPPFYKQPPYMTSPTFQKNLENLLSSYLCFLVRLYSGSQKPLELQT